MQRKIVASLLANVELIVEAVNVMDGNKRWLAMLIAVLIEVLFEADFFIGIMRDLEFPIADRRVEPDRIILWHERRLGSDAALQERKTE